MTPFPLLHLPLLVNKEVLDYMNLIEQYNLSEVSKKSRRLVKNYLARRRSPFRLSINCSSSFLLELMDQKDEGLVFTRKSDEVESWIENLADVFNISQVSLDFDENEHLFVKNIIRTIKKLNIRIEQVDVVSLGIDDKLYEVILDECRNVSTLGIDCEISSAFEYTNSHSEPFQCDSLRIIHVKWIAVKQLVDLFMDCREVLLDDCGYVTSNELKKFLARWVIGCKLEYCQLPYFGYVFSSIFENISTINVNQVKIDGSIQNFADGTCYLIRDVNGKEAVVYREEKINEAILEATIPPRASEYFILTTDFEL